MKSYGLMTGLVIILIGSIFAVHFSWQKKYAELSAELNTTVRQIEEENKKMRETLSGYCERISRLERAVKAVRASGDCASKDAGESKIENSSETQGESKVTDTFEIVDDEG